MNGRELTAYDVEYNFHRYFGLGSGFTEPSPHLLASGELVTIPYESITATDKWTVVFKLKAIYLPALKDTLTHWGAYINPPEVIKEYGDVNDWRKVVGTGPYELTDFVEGSSIAWTKNPDYWKYDEKYPENRLPYCDELKALIIKERAAYLAALRAGKVDHLGFIGGYLNSIDQVESLKRTNPEIVLDEWDYRSELGFTFNQRVPSPTNDIRVRHALQMALDLETINDTYFKGYAKWIPQGLIGEDVSGYATPFEEWPEEVKKFYMYDPEGAEKLLDEAGYTRGADGIRFKTPMLHSEGTDLGYVELAVAYWADIGIDVEIRTTDRATAIAMTAEHSYEGLSTFAAGGGGYDYPPLVPLVWFQSEGWTPSGVQDPVYDAMYAAAAAATTIEEQQRLVKEADMYTREQHWSLWGPKVPSFNATQPWVKGYDGECELGRQDRSAVLFARLWIDQDLKKEMGY
jgi:peptide/nickel transport system substrate-binding protein